MWQFPILMPDLPAQEAVMFGFYDLVLGTWYVTNAMNDKQEQYKAPTQHYPDSIYSLEALANNARCIDFLNACYPKNAFLHTRPLH